MDEPEMYAGGTAALLAGAGHAVKFASLTNGDAGHHLMEPVPLARRRAREGYRAAEALGVLEYDIFDDVHDGELEATVAVRRRVIGLVRRWRADVVIGLHADGPGHPDNRAAGRLTADAVALCTIRNVVPEVPALERQPMCLLMTDFSAGPVHRADISVDVAEVLEAKLDAVLAHESQFFEVTPFYRGFADAVPSPQASREERREFLLKYYPTFLGATETFQLAGYGRAFERADLPF